MLRQEFNQVRNTPADGYISGECTQESAPKM